MSLASPRCGAWLLLVLLLWAGMRVRAASLGARLRTRVALQPVSANPARHPFDRLPHMDLLEFHTAGRLPGDDPMEQLRALWGPAEFAALERVAAEQPADAEQSGADAEAAASSFVELGAQVGAGAGAGAGLGVGKVRSFCEICILVMQMKERGQPHLCAGLNTNYHITCIEVLESLLRADKAVVYWLKNGCMHMDADGPEIVRPCPALNICSWTPNLFADAPSLVRDGVESLCPKDPKFLPTIPQEFRNLLGNADDTAHDDSAPDGPVDATTHGL